MVSDPAAGTAAGPVWSLVEARAAATPAALMAVDELDRTMTFGAYRERAEAVAAGLAARGVGPGTPVSWMLPTWLEALVLAGALARLGALQNPLIPAMGRREVEFAVAQTGARLLVVPPARAGADHPAVAAAIAAAHPGLDVLVVDRSGERPLPTGGLDALPAPPAGDAVRWHFYTSGTTAVPKGARHTDASLTASAAAVNRSVQVGPDDRVGVVFPYTHVGGIALLVGALLAGYGQILVESFAAPSTLPTLRRHGVTVAGAGTVFWSAYLDAQAAQPGERLFPRLRALVGGGSAKPAGIHDRVRRELGGRGVVSGYGLTECPSCVLGSVHDPDDKLADTDGRPAAGVEVRVVAPDGSDCPAGTPGEVRVRGPMLFAGYVDPALDADAYDEQGWLRTGDLGRLDADGYLRITGRLKEVVIRKGENVSVREVEDVLLTHPAVRDVAVVGLPDDERGELACAVVVPAAGAAADLAELAAHCRAAGLATYKTPERVELVDALPRNPAGKVLRTELVARYAGAAAVGAGDGGEAAR